MSARELTMMLSTASTSLSRYNGKDLLPDGSIASVCKFPDQSLILPSELPVDNTTISSVVPLAKELIPQFIVLIQEL
jgi:hypothetical protein